MDKERTDLVRASILQAAETLFQKWGVNKTTMEDIAREAGRGRGTVYHHFKSREDVLEAVAEAKAVRMAGDVMKEMAAKDTAREKLHVLMHATFRELRRDMALCQIIRGACRIDKSLSERIQKKFDAIDLGIIEPVLRLGIERREFKFIHPGNIDVAARAIAAVKKGLATTLFIEDNDKPVVDFVMTILSEGL